MCRSAIDSSTFSTIGSRESRGYTSVATDLVRRYLAQFSLKGFLRLVNLLIT